MGVSFEPSIGDSLQHPLEEFVKGLGDYLKPNHAFQQGMQKAIGANPQLAQDLADLEYNAPGTLHSMGFGSLGDILSRVPESPKSQFARQNRGEILQNEKKALDLSGAQTGFNLERLNATIDALRSDPTLSADEIHKKLTGLTIDQAKGVRAETAIKEAEVGHVQAEAELEKAQLPVKLAQAKREQALQETIDANPEIQGYDAMNLVRQYMSGKNIPFLREYLSLPGGNQAFQHAQTIAELQAQRDATAANRAMMNHQIDAEERAKILAARQLQMQTKGASTLAAFRTILEDPQKIEEIKKKDPTTLTQPEKDVLAATNAQQELVNTQQSKELGAKNVELIRADQAARVAIKGGDPAEIEKNLSLTNNIFAQKAAQSGGELFQAVYGAMPAVGKKVGADERRFGGLAGAKHGLYYVNSEGTRVEDNLPFKNYQGGLSAAGLDFLSRYNSPQATPAIKAAALDRLKKERPEVYKEIQSKLPK